jgi:hypothetical protein
MLVQGDKKHTQATKDLRRYFGLQSYNETSDIILDA